MVISHSYVKLPEGSPVIKCFPTIIDIICSNHCGIIDYSLVGGIPTPLKNMKVSWDDDIPNWMEK